jgi:UDP-2-acetamido-2,6-beta-L-arabino-hexul-4-ose reductase
MTKQASRARVVVTGGDGFLGWHTRVRLRALCRADAISIGRRSGVSDLENAVRNADVVLHLAGINRGSDADVEQGNIALAERLISALRATGSPAAVVYASSTQAVTDTPYGRGKRAAGVLLRTWGSAAGHPVADVQLPGLFGEHGRPNYNSFVATFAHQIAIGMTTEVTADRALPLLHVQQAAGLLLDAWQSRAEGILTPSADQLRISEVRDMLLSFHDVYRHGEIPAVRNQAEVALFNTLRAAMFPANLPLRPISRSDERGTLVESVRVHGGQGQTFASSTRPGFVRGDHFHLHKIERFQVLSGCGVIRVRRLLHDQCIEFHVSGERPAAVDMPTMWAHSIENVGSEDLVTLFWAHELFDAEHPDTYSEPVLNSDARQ